MPLVNHEVTDIPLAGTAHQAGTHQLVEMFAGGIGVQAHRIGQLANAVAAFRAR